MQNKVLGFFLFFIFLSGCGGVQGKPVPLPVPFAGALDDSARVVVANGSPVGGNASLQLAFKSQQVEPRCSSFSTVDSVGEEVGECEYCENSELVTSTIIVNGQRKDRFTIPVTCLVDGETVSAEVECFDFPHFDDNIDIASFIPQGESGELRKGLCSGIISFGEGSFVDAPDNATMDGKYVTISKLEEGKKIHFHHLQWVWIIHR